jgi:hypothetical protein
MLIEGTKSWAASTDGTRENSHWESRADWLGYRSFQFLPRRPGLTLDGLRGDFPECPLPTLAHHPSRSHFLLRA